MISFFVLIHLRPDRYRNYGGREGVVYFTEACLGKRVQEVPWCLIPFILSQVVIYRSFSELISINHLGCQ